VVLAWNLISAHRAAARLQQDTEAQAILTVATTKPQPLSELANRASFFEASSINRQFDVVFQFEQPDPRLKAGSSARVVIEGKEVADALHVPRQAVFDKNGKNHVFVKVGDRFEQREVKVIQRTESRVAVSGLAAGTEVALVDPSSTARSSSASSASPMPAAGGPAR